MKLPLLAFVWLALAGLVSAQTNEIITLRGSTVVARAVATAVEDVKKNLHFELSFRADQSVDDIVDNLANDIFDLGLFTRPISATQRARHPSKKFVETLIGKQVVLVVVPDQVWRSGVKALTKEQLRNIYERDVKNWKQLGGEDRDIVYYNREVGRGIWDAFMIYLYGDVRKAPLSKAEVLTNADEVRTGVEFNGGAISLLEYGEKRDGRLHALGLRLEDGTIIEPTPENIASGRYALSRPLFMLTSKVPTGKVRTFLEYMVSEKGQEFVKRAGHVPLAELVPPKDPAK